MTRVALVFILGMATACGQGDPSWRDVAPIVEERCVGCHHESGIAPFALTEAADFALRANLIEAVLASETMPPFPPAGCENCEPLDDPRDMPDEERSILRAWLADDPETESTVLSPPTSGLDAPDLTLDIGGGYLPDPGLEDDYRCFVADGPTDDAFVTAVEVVPGDTRIVHHAIVYATADDEAAALARTKDESERGPGYQCFGDSGVPGAKLVGGWAPGERASRFPEGTGVPISAGRPFIVQVHYHPIAEPILAPTRVQLELASSVPQPASSLLITETDFSIPPRTAGYEVEKSVLVGARRLFGVFPHMHGLGREITVSVVPAGGGEERFLVAVPDWDFDWQGYYFFRQPVDLGMDDVIRLRCTFDNTTADPVSFGVGTDDEMCLVFAFASE